MSVNAQVSNLDVEAIYFEYENLINHTVWAFVRKYGGHFEDLRADANIAVVRAVREYNGNGKISAWIHNYIFGILLDEYRTKASRLAKTGPMAGTDSVALAADRKKNDFCVEDFVEELSSDARLVVSLCLELPADLQKIADEKGGTPRNIRSTVKQHLSTIGWAASRITEAFQEVASAF